MNVCTDLQLLNILRIFRLLIDIMRVAVPTVLVVFIILDIIKTTASNEVDTKKLSQSIGKRVILAAMIFLIPMIINFVISIFSNSSYYLNCYDNAKSSYILETSIDQANSAYETAKDTCGKYPDYNEYEKFRQAVKQIPNKEKRDTYNASLIEIKNLCDKK